MQKITIEEALHQMEAKMDDYYRHTMRIVDDLESIIDEIEDHSDKVKFAMWVVDFMYKSGEFNGNRPQLLKYLNKKHDLGLIEQYHSIDNNEEIVAVDPIDQEAIVHHYDGGFMYVTCDKENSEEVTEAKHEVINQLKAEGLIK